MTQLKSLLKILGPGLLFASLAIGTSHLVLSTTAGATYGWLMVIPIILANVLKYPFFEFSVRYTKVTGKSLVEGYSRMGKSYVWIYAGITLVTRFIALSMSMPVALPWASRWIWPPGGSGVLSSIPAFSRAAELTQ